MMVKKNGKKGKGRKAQGTAVDPACEWVEWGGVRMLAFGEREGGAPYGLTEDEFRKLEEREAAMRLRGEERRASHFEHCRVNAEDLIKALNGDFFQGIWLLDLETGAVLSVSQEELVAEPEEPYEDPRYLPIRPLESFIGFGIMEDFISELPVGAPRGALERALRRRRPFRFKDALLNFPVLREAWFRFHDARMLDHAREWLEEEVPGARLDPARRGR